MHQSWKKLSVVFGAALCGALLASAIMSVPTQMTSGIYAEQVQMSVEAKNNIATGDNLSAAFRNVAQTIKPSVVSIRSHTQAKVRQSRGRGMQPDLRGQLPPWLPDEFLRQFDGQFDGGQMQTPERQGMGSGVIARADGHVLTNNHVVEGADELIVELSDGRKIEGKVVGTDPATDLAVIKIEATGLQPAVFGDSDKIEVGDWVLAIGSPFALEQTVTAGIISGKNRVQGIVDDGDGFEDFLQTDAAINPGNSGGPLVNLRGELVGINTAILSRSGTSAGIGFAIPVGLAKPVMEAIISTGSVHRGFLGAQVADINPDVVKQFDLKTDSGALIRAVINGQPAALAGLQPGDVVTRIDGKPVTSGTQLKNLIASKPPGATVTLSLNRNGATQDLRVNLQERTSENLAMMQGNLSDSVMGAKLEPMTPETARDLGINGKVGGLVVTEIADGSPAAEAGLAIGDVIEQAGGKPLTSVAELKSMLLVAKESGRNLLVVIRRGNSRSMLSIQQ